MCVCIALCVCIVCICICIVRICTVCFCIVPAAMAPSLLLSTLFLLALHVFLHGACLSACFSACLSACACAYAYVSVWLKGGKKRLARIDMRVDMRAEILTKMLTLLMTRRGRRHGGQVRTELGAVLYDRNVLGTNGPRKMQVHLPSTSPAGVRDKVLPPCLLLLPPPAVSSCCLSTSQPLRTGAVSRARAPFIPWHPALALPCSRSHPPWHACRHTCCHASSISRDAPLCACICSACARTHVGSSNQRVSQTA